MQYLKTEDGFTLDPDDDLDDCLVSPEQPLDDDELLDDETQRPLQTVQIVEKILEALMGSRLTEVFNLRKFFLYITVKPILMDLPDSRLLDRMNYNSNLRQSKILFVAA